jgi:hypothetical protein
LDWFFQQWATEIEGSKETALPQFRLRQVRAQKDETGWQLRGWLRQIGKTFFRLPVNLVLETAGGAEQQTIWQDHRTTEFTFRTTSQPRRLRVDPQHEIIKIPRQRMYPYLIDFWGSEPEEVMMIFGTRAETEANRKVAESFARDYFESEGNILKSDTAVTEEDLRRKTLILFGRPTTNRITQRFRDIFPIRFKGNQFTWQGITYDQPSQGVAQIVRPPQDPDRLVVLFAALSSQAMEQIGSPKKFGNDYPFWESYRYDQLYGTATVFEGFASYIIFDGDRMLVHGDWEVEDPDLVWTFEAPKEE